VLRLYHTDFINFFSNVPWLVCFSYFRHSSNMMPFGRPSLQMWLNASVCVFSVRTWVMLNTWLGWLLTTSSTLSSCSTNLLSMTSWGAFGVGRNNNGSIVQSGWFVFVMYCTTRHNRGEWKRDVCWKTDHLSAHLLHSAITEKTNDKEQNRKLSTWQHFSSGDLDIWTWPGHFQDEPASHISRSKII